MESAKKQELRGICDSITREIKSICRALKMDLPESVTADCVSRISEFAKELHAASQVNNRAKESKTVV